MHTKHEIIPCDRCGTGIECKANSYTKCQCSVVQLNLNEVQYISENYEGCMCANCLLAASFGYQPTATIMYCGLATDRSADWLASSS